MKPKLNDRHAAERLADELRGENVVRFVTRAELEERTMRTARKGGNATRDDDHDDDSGPPAA